MRLELLRGYVLLAALCAVAGGPAYAEKGDLKFQVPKSAPLLQGKTLDLRFAKFAQGIWVTDLDYCPAPSIDRSVPGTTLAIYRGLLETPGRICQVYGAEQSDGRTQRAAINCLLTDGGEAIELVTVQPRGTNVLMVQEGEDPPVQFRFCRKIIPILQAASN
ncbi:hypothetical protein [Roseibium marinum]|uniref:Uncharacterized protein n=1 Tax=Roseibium marinum TaxID=281252 RepID=A0A2S3V217_9HYPH|nr:hypothetical protein [Roseibium marinum]POF33729.1 hypothetical protein CLV41_101178 [Roseibium marinum]